jgi:hypothetical protein
MEYYNLDEFKEANKLFEEYINKLRLTKGKEREKSIFNVTTLTSTCTILNKHLEESFLRKIYDDVVIGEGIYENIVYIQINKNTFKGNKKIKVKKYKLGDVDKTTDKRKLNKGNPFSNQISFGIKCTNPKHEHKNNICVKLFKNGSLHLTGCKDKEEIKEMYNTIKNILTNYTDKGDIKEYNEKDINIVMSNGTYITGFKIDLAKTRDLIRKNFTESEMYINNDKKIQLSCSYKKLSKINIVNNKKKEIYPSLFIYNSGAINIMACNLDVLYETYNMIKDFIAENYNNIVVKNYNFDV